MKFEQSFKTLLLAALFTTILILSFTGSANAALFRMRCVSAMTLAGGLELRSDLGSVEWG